MERHSEDNWVDNDNVVRVLEKRLGIERADAVWAVAENWAADSQELEPPIDLQSTAPTQTMIPKISGRPRELMRIEQRLIVPEIHVAQQKGLNRF